MRENSGLFTAVSKGTESTTYLSFQRRLIFKLSGDLGGRGVGWGGGGVCVFCLVIPKNKASKAKEVKAKQNKTNKQTTTTKRGKF